MDVEKIKAIFLEEASEIIEALDVNIIDFEENPSDKELLNSIFRGVHTLKGSVNSFGYTRLGAFVHHFEDLLDFYRSSDDVMSTETIDICLESVDMVKEVFEYEIQETEGLPSEYERVLKNIQGALGKPVENTVESNIVEPSDELNDIGAEFGETFDTTLTEYTVHLKLDDDIFIRGNEPFTIIKGFKSVGELQSVEIKTLETLPDLVALNTRSYYMQIDITLLSSEPLEEIQEVLFYLDEEEYSIEVLNAKTVDNEEEIKDAPVEVTPPVIEAEPSVIEVVEPEAEKDKTEEVVAVKSANKPAPSADMKRSVVKIDTAKLDELFDSVGELVIAQNYLAENQTIRDLEDDAVDKTLESLSKITKTVQGRVMSLRMIPIRDSFDKMKRVIRDASKKVNKEVQLDIRGEETEIDKTIVEKLADPLIHLIRNAVDHGLEPDEASRIAAGKEKTGVVKLEAFHKGGNIIIEISDDGRGIDKEKILQKAISKELVASDAKLTDQQIYLLLFAAGFSTAAVISDISGRGVGLDVVRSNIESIRGKIEVDSVLGKGSTFRIILPLTLAIIDGMLVKSDDEVFIIPTLSVIESFIATSESKYTIKGSSEFVKLRDEMLPLVRLNIVLGLSDTKVDITDRTLICIENDLGKFALLVDELVGRQQVVVKALGKILSKSKEVSGGAVLGNGDIALILNVDELSI